MLCRIVAAAGFEMDLALKASQAKTVLGSKVEFRKAKLVRDLTKLGAHNVRLFGSVARGDDGPDSDVDLLIDVDPTVGLFALGRMRSEAERILGATVDIVPANSLKPDVAERILAEAIPL
jgi:hypothetical protein